MVVHVTSDLLQVQRLTLLNDELQRRLLESERYTAETLLQATRLSQVIAMLGHHEAIEQTLARVSIQVADMFSADIVLFLLGPDDALQVEGRWGLRANEVPLGPIDVTQQNVNCCADHGESAWVGSRDEIWLPEWLHGHGASEIAWVRLQAQRGSLGHMLILRFIDVPFALDERTGLRAIAHRIALAIENGRLHTQLGLVLERNLAIAEQERARVALDLHDGPIQHLTVVALKLDLCVMQLQAGAAIDAGQVSELREQLGDEISSLRRLMTGLRSPVLDERGLDAALRDSALRVFADAPVTVDIASNVEGARLAPEIEAILVRVTREALTNVRKHASATRVDIRLVLDESNVRLNIRDDGLGFGELPPDIRAEHLGLVSLGELAESIGGSCTVVSAPGEGVEVRVVVPRREPGRWGIT